MVIDIHALIFFKPFLLYTNKHHHSLYLYFKNESYIMKFLWSVIYLSLYKSLYIHIMYSFTNHTGFWKDCIILQFCYQLPACYTFYVYCWVHIHKILVLYYSGLDQQIKCIYKVYGNIYLKDTPLFIIFPKLLSSI